MTGKLIIYGTTGYTGQLVSELVKQAGLDFIVAGCDAEKARALAEKFGVCRFQLIRRPNDFQRHYASIKSRLNAVFSVKSCTVWSLP